MEKGKNTKILKINFFNEKRYIIYVTVVKIENLF